MKERKQETKRHIPWANHTPFEEDTSIEEVCATNCVIGEGEREREADAASSEPDTRRALDEDEDEDEDSAEEDSESDSFMRS